MPSYDRAAIRRRSRSTRRTRSSTPMIITIIVVIAIFGTGIFLTLRQRSANASVAPRVATATKSGDHWHAYLGVNVCGTWIDNAPEYTRYANSASTAEPGIHSHGDGLVHIHPFISGEAGKNATLGKFISNGGWKLSSTSMKLWDGQTHKNGDECPAGSNYDALRTAADPTSSSTSTSTPSAPASAAPGEIVWTVNGKKQTGNPANYRPKDKDVIAIGFLPKDVPLPVPPNAAQALANISDLPPGQSAATATTPLSPPVSVVPGTTP
ncbi:MAG: hypothetical protein ACOYN3_05630 [Acidimicrobiia bacterium]